MPKLTCLLLLSFILNIAQSQPPTITSFSPTSGPVGTLVTITGTNLSNPTSITIGGVAALPISNTGSGLVVMVMPNTVSGGISFSNAAGIASSTGDFSIVASVTPSVQQGDRLVGTGVNIYSNTQANQGYSVSISADGNTVLVGGNLDNNNQGAAWVYTKIGGAWVQQGNKLVGAGNVGAAQQGSSVCLSADGNTAIVGGPVDNSSQGAAWVYTRSGNTWSQQGSKLVGTGNYGAALQGVSVGLSADGNTAIIGGSQDSNFLGAVWVFTRTAGIWSQQGSKLVGTGNIGDSWQGKSVSLSADGNTAIVGGYGDNNSKGAAWIFARSGSTWSQQGNKLIGSDHIGTAVQGISVAISADGNTAIVGGYGDNDNKGAAWIYTRTAGVWNQQGNKLVGTGNLGTAIQGSSASLSADGNIAVVGGYQDNFGKGATWVYKRSGNSWNQVGNKLVGTSTAIGGGWQGYAVSLNATGNVVVIGAPWETGAIWMFASSSSLPTTITSFKAFQKSTSIQVEWDTKNETNLSIYEVEKSTNGSSFSKAGTVMAKGQSNYNWLDANPINGNNYYRLKIVDKDGSVKYSSIVNVKIGGINNVFTIAGNPVKNGQLTLQLENVEKGTYALSIYNNLGQQVVNKSLVHEGGSATQTMYLGNLSKGSYQLNITNKDTKVTKTFIIQ